MNIFMKYELGSQRSYHFNYVRKSVSEAGLRARQSNGYQIGSVAAWEKTTDVNFRVNGRNAAFAFQGKSGRHGGRTKLSTASRVTIPIFLSPK